MKHLIRLLIVENEPQDAKRAAETAKLAGFAEVEARTTPQSARAYLEDLLALGRTRPDGIVLDLDFGVESGYELLRFWHSTPKLREVPVVVWSVMGDEQRKMCDLFRVKQFVGKWEANEVLQQVLQSIVQSASCGSLAST
jgi:CheY-like chemotaxis protein